MWSPFRKKHLQILLETAEKSKVSLDLHTHRYFKENHSLGSKDRLHVKKGLYEIFKWKELLFAYKVRYPRELVDLYTSEESPLGADNSHLPSHVQVSFPKWLFVKIVDSLGYEKAMEFCKISNEEAPTTIRVNAQKTTVDTFYNKYKDQLLLTKCEFAKDGLQVGKKTQFNSIPEFLKGHFEPQDEASQIIAEYVNAKPNQHILDYCAGSGGKSLAFASHMEGTGQVHLHDIRHMPLVDAKKRLKRAGIQNFQIYQAHDKRLRGLRGNMDAVLIDAPCSCSGTLRRRPDQKWGLTEEFVKEVTVLQRDILIKAIPYLKKGGTLIYATCSILAQENEDQLNFLKERKELTYESSKTVDLKSGGSDAMFLAVFKRA
jgi:16S rRNA (cytosine967-C5)-methyltransferase